MNARNLKNPTDFQRVETNGAQSDNRDITIAAAADSQETKVEFVAQQNPKNPWKEPKHIKLQKSRENFYGFSQAFKILG